MMSGLLLRLCVAVALCASVLGAQGVATRQVQPAPRGEPSGLPFHAKFVDVAQQAGLRTTIVYGGIDRKDYIIETIGTGAAFFDYDNDGWIDILLLSGTRFGEEGNNSIHLYRNNRDGSFTDVTEKAGLAKQGWGSSIAIGDYDNDGHEDMFLTYFGTNILYRNNGEGVFEDVTRQAGLFGDDTRWGAGATFVDYDRDGNLDLFISHYLKFDLATAPKKGSTANCTWKGVPVNCGPRGLPPETPLLYRNNGDGTFSDVTKVSGVGGVHPGYGMTVLAADFDGDGWPDIYVASDSTPSLLFRNNHDGTFTEEGLERGGGLSEDGMEQAGMGAAVGDYDCDGDLDIFKTHFADDTNVLYENDGKGFFEDRTVEAGLAVETRFVGWGAGIADLDNDGRPDLFYVTGSVYPEVAKQLPEYPYETPRVLFRNLGGGKFEELIEEAGPGIAAPHASRGAAFGDYDNDGDLDILIVNLNEPPSLLRNDLSSNAHWLQVKLIGGESNRSAIGARVTVAYGEKRQVQEVMSQSSFYSVNDFRLHFGLGDAEKSDLTIRWPNGKVEKIGAVAVDRLISVREGKGVEPVKK